MDRSRSWMRRGAPAAWLALGAALGCNAIIGAGDYKVAATGADAGASGGAAAGGSANGGSSGATTGGATSSGGNAASGGSTTTGGTAGTTASGGTSGTANGGTTASGGTSGTANGGTTASGGVASGGTASGGATAAGGATATGGTTAGSGGAATGGAGGRGNGGTAGGGGAAEDNASGESTCTGGAGCANSLTCVTTPYGTTGICTEACTTTCATGHLCATESGTSNSYCLQDCSTVACVDKSMRCLQTAIAHVCIPSGWKGGGLGDPCSSTAPCIDGTCLKTSTTTAGFCSADCTSNADCNGSGTNGVNAEGQKNWCVDDSVNGDICYAGCDTLSTVCSKYPGTSCQTITGTTEKACASTN